MRITLSKTVERIAERSLVAWNACSGGLALALGPDGYVLTQQPDRYPDAMPGRVTPPGMVAGHVLTQREREAAVLALLDGGEAPKAKGKRPGWRFRRSIGLVTPI